MPFGIRRINVTVLASVLLITGRSARAQSEDQSARQQGLSQAYDGGAAQVGQRGERGRGLYTVTILAVMRYFTVDDEPQTRVHILLAITESVVLRRSSAFSDRRVFVIAGHDGTLCGCCSEAVFVPLGHLAALRQRCAVVHC